MTFTISIVLKRATRTCFFLFPSLSSLSPPSSPSSTFSSSFSLHPFDTTIGNSKQQDRSNDKFATLTLSHNTFISLVISLRGHVNRFQIDYPRLEVYEKKNNNKIIKKKNSIEWEKKTKIDERYVCTKRSTLRRIDAPY